MQKYTQNAAYAQETKEEQMAPEESTSSPLDQKIENSTENTEKSKEQVISTPSVVATINIKTTTNQEDS